MTSFFNYLTTFGADDDSPLALVLSALPSLHHTPENLPNLQNVFIGLNLFSKSNWNLLICLGRGNALQPKYEQQTIEACEILVTNRENKLPSFSEKRERQK
jgi:hypothetical protein